MRWPAIQSTIFDQVDEMLAWSDNTTAELLTKEIGRRAAGSGTTGAGTPRALAVLRQLGLPTDGLCSSTARVSIPATGSRATCSSGCSTGPGPTRPWPTACRWRGARARCRKRMRRTAAEGNVLAKTGTLGTVTSLAGFVKTRRGETVTFAFIQNGPRLDTALQDDLAEVLHAFPEAPDLADLVPPPD